MKSIRKSKTLLVLVCIVWLGIVVCGLGFVSLYANSAGRSGTPPASWPTESAITRKAGKPTLVLFIHPHCPCSRATIGELAILMAHSQGLVNTNAVFVKPAGFDEAWTETDLWSSASNIPGVNVSIDENAAEAQRFASETSGQAALYSAEGQLLFSGGITGARGHSGDNDGRSAILALLLTGKSGTAQTPVFGCPLFANDSSTHGEEFCDASHGK